VKVTAIKLIKHTSSTGRSTSL